MAATLLYTILSTSSSGAAAETRAPANISVPVPGFGPDSLETSPVPDTLSGDAPAPVQADPNSAVANSAVAAPVSLQALVAAQPVGEEVEPEMKCLASAIYYESRSESLAGQLAVGRVIVNRARSGRFPSSYCGVINQPSQFSFIHGPRGALNARQWHNAVAIAQIAHDGSWQSEAEGALYFHAARVSPGWNAHKVARIDSQIFYR